MRTRSWTLAAMLVLHAGAASAQQVRPPEAAGTTPPTVLKHVDAVYPESAKAERKHSNVVLTVTVDKEGHVSKVAVATSGGDDIDQAAIAAVKQWQFQPALRNGQPIAAKITIPFHFAPPNEAPEGDEEPTKPDASAPSPHFDRVEEKKSLGGGGETSDTVVVQGRALPPSRGGSDFHVHLGELDRVPHQSAADMLKFVPGVLLTNEGGEGHAQQVFMRGFSSDDGQDIEFSVDGVPINESGNIHATGYADTHFIVPELVRSMRVVQGPFDPRQGNYAVAGSVDYELGLARRGITAKYTMGSFATRRLLLLWGPPKESLHTFGGAEIYETDGFGQNRAARRASGIGQYEGKLGENGSWRVTGQAYASDYRAAGAIREDDYQAGRVGFYDTYDPRQGGQSSRFSIAGDVESKTGSGTTVNQKVFVISRSMHVFENFTGFTEDEPQQRGDLHERAIGTTTIGSRGWARMRNPLFGQPQELEVGYFARYDDAQGTDDRIEAATQRAYTRDVDLASKLGDVGLYGDLNLKPVAWTTLRGGARADLFTYDIVDRTTQAHTTMASRALMPRASILFGPFSDVTLSASYGQGFRALDPVLAGAEARGVPFSLIDAYEGGASYALSSKSVAVQAKSMFFVTRVDRDLAFNENTGRSGVTSGSTRTGWMGALRATGSFFDTSANVTMVRATYDESHELVPYVPRFVVRDDTVFFENLPLSIDGDRVRGSVGAGITYVGPRVLPEGARSDDVFTLDASVGASWRWAELTLSGTNLLDSRYRLGEYNYASNFHTTPQPVTTPVRHFNAGAPRAVFLSLALTWGGG